MTIAFRIMVSMILVAAVVTHTIKAVNPRKLDDTTVVGSPNDEVKCGTCPCGTTCYTSPPPPPPPSPPPPPPPKKQTPTPGGNCPPPPYSGGGGKAPPNYIYIAGPPGDLYPIVQSVSAACRSFTAALLLVTSGLLGMLAFW